MVLNRSRYSRRSTSFVLGRHDDHQRSPAIMHFLVCLRSPLAGFINLCRRQILGFGRHLPGDCFSVGLPGRDVQINVLSDAFAGSPICPAVGRIFLRFIRYRGGPSALGRKAREFDNGAHDWPPIRVLAVIARFPISGQLWSVNASRSLSLHSAA